VRNPRAVHARPAGARRRRALLVLAVVVAAGALAGTLAVVRARRNSAAGERAAAVGGTASPSPAPAERVLHFPDDCLLGELYVRVGDEGVDTVGLARRSDAVLSDDRFGNRCWWRPLGPTCGDVAVPADAPLKLVARSSQLRDFSALSLLAPDALHTLDLHHSTYKQGQLAHVATLSGLKELDAEWRPNDRLRGPVPWYGREQSDARWGTGPPVDDFGLLKQLRSLERITMPVDAGPEHYAIAAEIPALRVLCAAPLRRGALQGLAGAKTITEVRLAFVHSFELAPLASLPDLTTLWLSGLQRPELAPTYLARMLSLRHLLMPRGALTADGAARLAGLRLETIDLCGPRAAGTPMRFFGLVSGLARPPSLTDAAMAEISRIRTLRVLRASCPPVTGAGCAALGRCGRLEELRLEGCSLTDAALARIAGCRRLRILHLDTPGCGSFTDRGIRHLAALQRLEHLTIDGGGLTDDAARSIARLQQLRSVELRCSTNLTEDGVAVLAGLPALEQLLVRAPFAAAQRAAAHVASTNAASALLWLEQGLRLSLSSGDDGNTLAVLLPYGSDPEWLACFGDVHHLKLTGWVTREAAPAAARMPALESLVLHGAVTADGFRSLAAAPRLARLECSAMAMTPDVLDALAGLCGLKELCVGLGAAPPPDAEEYLRARLPDLQSLLIYVWPDVDDSGPSVRADTPDAAGPALEPAAAGPL
jgi:hypothetical protein